jgi:hypothetical protein
MYKSLFLLIFLLLAKSVNAQVSKSIYLKLDNGIMLSSFRNSINVDILANNNSNYSTSIGIDYLQKKWFCLSSQIGYARIGGREANDGLVGTSNFKISENSDYVHVNTTIRVTTQRRELNFFAGVGPYFNLLVSSNNFKSDFYKNGYQFKEIYGGGKTEVGISRNINKIRISVVGSYMFNLSPSASTDFITLNNKTYSTMLSLGYMIR